MKKLTFIIIIAVAAIALIFVFRVGENESPATDNNQAKKQIDGETEQSEGQELKIGTKIGNLAPDFKVTDYEGNAVRLSDFRGKKPVFVNFWASWCPFCLDEMPLMAKIQEQFGGVYVTIAINRAEGLKTAKKFSDELGVTDKYIVALDDDDSVYKRYNGFSMPYSIFVDKEGVIRDVKLGPITEQELIEKIEKIIE